MLLAYKTSPFSPGVMDKEWLSKTAIIEIYNELASVSFISILKTIWLIAICASLQSTRHLLFKAQEFTSSNFF
jgi:hypothetical protein